ncbi:unnamed protein product [Zymoseptoria tritici ST99CH_3D7]|uniref:Uncharacterized protein n=1 Tax=Zymoseptoria tritici (strain ST99CH_3D7) TaxID=1276538 RepID=A0A1X7RCJ7_ZYMT9|nr:unnamed protein product [Zymoseptoria tritici ST99CH_3D7]
MLPSKVALLVLVYLLNAATAFNSYIGCNDTEIAALDSAIDGAMEFAKNITKTGNSLATLNPAATVVPDLSDDNVSALQGLLKEIPNLMLVCDEDSVMVQDKCSVGGFGPRANREVVPKFVWLAATMIGVCPAPTFTSIELGGGQEAGKRIEGKEVGLAETSELEAKEMLLAIKELTWDLVRRLAIDEKEIGKTNARYGHDTDQGQERSGQMN